MEYKTPVINGTTYAYIDTAFWNSSKKRGEHKRKYIGKILDGVFIPNKRFQLEQQVESSGIICTKAWSCSCRILHQEVLWCNVSV